MTMYQNSPKSMYIIKANIDANEVTNSTYDSKLSFEYSYIIMTNIELMAVSHYDVICFNLSVSYQPIKKYLSLKIYYSET